MPRQLQTISERLTKNAEEKHLSDKIRQAILIAPYPGQGRVMHVQLSDPTYGSNLVVRAEVMSGLETGSLPIGSSVTVKITRGKVRVVGVGGSSGLGAGGELLLGGMTFNTQAADITGAVCEGSILRLDGAGPGYLHGVAGGEDGRLITIFAEGGGVLDPFFIISDSTTEPIAENRFRVHDRNSIPLYDDIGVQFIYDGDKLRWRPIGHWPSPGQPFAYAMGTDHTTVATGTTNLSAVSGGLGGARAIPVLVTAPMFLQSVTLWNTDTANARAAEMTIFADTGKAVAREAGYGLFYATLSFTPTVASARTFSGGIRSPLMPGIYWCIIRNTSTTQTFGLGQVAVGSLGGFSARNAPGSGIGNVWQNTTIAGWTGATGQSLVRFNGAIAAESGIFS